MSLSLHPGPARALAPGALLALAAALLMLAYHAAAGFPSLADPGGDNDSLLRLVQVRDLLAGQAWYDPTQYRMGPEGGFAMHWSRLVDLPIAALVLPFGETAALIAWPTLLYAVALFLIVRAARDLGGAEAVLPAAIIGGLTLHFSSLFRPGALDHHNLQFVLTLGALVFLLAAHRMKAAAALAGTCAALMLAVGMETAPYVAAACAVPTLAFLLSGSSEARAARDFGLGFAGVTAAVLVATVAPGSWLSVQCDALSLPQTLLAVLGGGGLALVASSAVLSEHVARRLAALAGLAAVVAAVALSLFPQCLAGPYADLDPRLRTFWLDGVSEARSLPDMLARDPAKALGFYATPFLALVTLAWAAWRGRAGRAAAIVAAFLGAAVLVSVWQVRGALFATGLATVPLAAWVGRAQAGARERPGLAGLLIVLGCWLASFSILWQAAGAVPGRIAGRAPAEAAARPAGRCTALSDFRALAALPQGTVLAVSNLGSSILAETHHRVLAGPYHRNQAGNLAMLDAMAVPPAEAEAAVRRAEVDYVVSCAGNGETRFLSRLAPDSLVARLAAGEIPAWLSSVAESADAPLTVFRVADDGR